MITIKTTDGRNLDLDIDLRLSIEETSVFESKQGGYSLPLHLPYTYNNAMVLGLPSNIDRRGEFLVSVDVIVSAGVWNRHAQFDVEEVVKDTYIQGTLFLRESPFYRKIEDLRLTDVFAEKIVTFSDSSELAVRVSSVKKHLEDVMIGKEEDDYYVFPVCVNIEEIETMERDKQESLRKTWKRYKILNQQVAPTPDEPVGAVSFYNGRKYYVLVGQHHECEEEEVLYSFPAGYGITPFLKFTYVLKEIFHYLGYTLQESVFDTDISFQRLCLLNNTIDAIVRGEIDYSQLVPDVTVASFFEFVENAFGCEFIIDEMYKRAIPRFWNDVLATSSGFNLTNKYENYPAIAYSKPEMIYLKTNREITEATPITFDSYDQLFSKYGPPTFVKSYASAVDALYSAGIMDGDYFYFVADKLCYMIFQDGYMGSRYVVEGDSLDFKKESSEITLREIDTKMEYVPMVDIPAGGVSGVRVDYKWDYAILPKEFRDALSEAVNKAYSTEDSLIVKMPFIDSFRHLNSVYQRKETKGDEELVTEEQEQEVKLPIMLCFYVGFAEATEEYPDLTKTIFATTHRYDNVGNEWGTFDITMKSLYEQFWAKYDEVLRTSWHTVSGAAQLKLEEVMGLRFDRQCLLNNQSVLPVSIQYELTNDGVEVSNLTVKTTKVYE